MRVLLVASSSPARLHHLVPLAWALRTAGHDVKIAGRPSFVDDILRTGCVAVDLDDDDCGDDCGDGADDGGSLVESSALVGFAELWRPEVVVSDGRAPAGAAAAGSVKALAVRLLGAPDEPDPLDGSDIGWDVGWDVTYDCVPPSLRAAGAGTRPVRHVPYFGPVEVPGWARRPPRRRRVLLCLADPASFGPVFAAAGDVDAELLCAADPGRVPAGIAVPANVRLVDAAPPAALLPGCAALVHDGDAALALAAATHGLPQLSVVDTGLAARIAAVGSGMIGSEGRIDAGQVHALLTDDTLRAGATALRDEIAAQPAPRAVVAELAR